MRVGSGRQWLSKLMVSQWGLITGTVKAPLKAGSSIVEEKQLSTLMAIQWGLMLERM